MLTEKLDELVIGKKTENFPSIERGRESISENTNSEKQYFAFGSDDIIQQSRPSKSKFEGLQSGKEMFSKFGNFITSSVSTLVNNPDEKIKESPINFKEKEIKTYQQSESQLNENKLVFSGQEKKDRPDKLVEFKDDIKHISSKIGKGFLAFGVFLLEQNTWFRDKHF